MHKHLHIARGLAGRIAAAVVVAVVTVTCCEARTALLPVEAGYPSDLINTPVCPAVETFDDGRNCRTIGWPEGRAHSPYRRMIARRFDDAAVIS